MVKRSLDYIEQIIEIAKKLQEDFKDLYDTGRIDRILEILKIIRKFDRKQLSAIDHETGSRTLMKLCEQIHDLTEEALTDMEEKWNFDKAEEVINRIIELETHLAGLRRIAPSREAQKILSYSPNRALAKRILFRGVSEADYVKILNGHDLTAVLPNARINLVQHILDPTNNPNTQYISLTSNVNIARGFGRPIPVEAKKLKGHLLSPKDLDGRTGGDTRVKKLRKKNFEFILEPDRTSEAKIPAESVVL